MIEILNKNDFAAKVLEAPGKVMVEFFATWCPHCQRMMPIVEDLAAREAGHATIYQVDVDKSPELAQEYAPDGFPTFVLFENGVLTKSVTGEQGEGKLVEMLA